MDQIFHSQRYDPVDSGAFVRDLVFVILPFSSDMNEPFSVIREECGKLGLTTRRADDAVGSGIILQEIVELIENAEFIICDLTHERPNVYYELGYAHGIGNESADILLIARDETVLHFDIAPLRVRYYKTIDDLREIIAINLPAMVDRSRKK